MKIYLTTKTFKTGLVDNVALMAGDVCIRRRMVGIGESADSILELWINGYKSDKTGHYITEKQLEKVMKSSSQSKKHFNQSELIRSRLY